MADEITTIALTEPITLHIRLGHGRLTVDMRDDLSEATVRLTPRVGGADLLDRIKVELRGTTLNVTGPRQGGLVDVVRSWRASDTVDVRVEVPTGTGLNVASANDDITVTGRSGDVDIATSATRLGLDDVDGALRMRYGKAECHVDTVTGPVKVSGGGGSVTIAEAGGPVVCQLGRGELDVQLARGAVHVRSGYGAVRVAEAHGEIDAATGFGPIDIGVPVGVAAHVAATTGHGEVVAGATLEQRPAAGAPRITVRARTGMGDITLRRVGAAAA
jgi:hypothetical protein